MSPMKAPSIINKIVSGESNASISSECIEWPGYINPNGYGQIHLHKGKGGKVQAHRYIYEREIGAIPEGLELDHLCRNSRCVNPLHLEPVTRKENLMRGKTMAAFHAAKKHCPRCGGEYSPCKSRNSRMARKCKRCINAAQNSRRHSKKNGVTNACVQFSQPAPSRLSWR